MKKSMILAGVLCIGYANAQTTEAYEGRVGINTEKPSATLNVKSKTGTGNSTKNLELTNANGTLLLNVLDSGHLGIRTKPFVDLDIVGQDNANAEIKLTRYGSTNGGNIVIAKSGGTFASPEIPAVGTSLGKYRVAAYTNNSSNGGFDGHSSSIETWSAGIPASNGNMPTYMILNVTALDGTRKPMVKIQGEGVGVGFNSSHKVEEILEVNGNTKILGLKGIGNRNVYADENGVLKVGDIATNTALQATTTDKICDATNAGTFYYKEKTVNGKKQGIMGFCTKQEDVYTWIYFGNGGNILQSAGSNQFDTL